MPSSKAITKRSAPTSSSPARRKSQPLYSPSHNSPPYPSRSRSRSGRPLSSPTAYFTTHPRNTIIWTTHLRTKRPRPQPQSLIPRSPFHAGYTIAYDRPLAEIPWRADGSGAYLIQVRLDIGEFPILLHVMREDFVVYPEDLDRQSTIQKVMATCRLGRRSALECWREVFREYEKEGVEDVESLNQLVEWALTKMKY